MPDLVLTPAERSFVEALQAGGVRFLVVGMGAALLEGAFGTTQDFDLWFGRLDPEAIDAAARRAGGFYSPGFGMQPPAVFGPGLERVDLVLTAHGLRGFDEEYASSREHDLDGLRVRVLPLARVIASKRALRRPKDAAQLPLLEAALAAREDPSGEA